MIGRDVVCVAAVRSLTPTHTHTHTTPTQGNEHTVVLTSDGDILTTGYNDNGQCGHSMTSRVKRLTSVTIDSNPKIEKIYAFNGCEHTFALDTRGKLWSFGYNYRGQLGHGNTISVSEPCLVQSLISEVVTLVSCSYYHSVVYCKSGALYTFGRNDFGQLGLGDNIDRTKPTRVAFDHDSDEDDTTTAIRSVACGQYHTLVLTQRDEIFGMGKNDYGQLGLSSETSRLCPTRITIPFSSSSLSQQHQHRVKEVRCGYYHSVVLSKRDVVTFGRNDYGQLGHGHAIQRFARPTSIPELHDISIEQVAAGCYHTILAASNGTIYAFGRNNHGQLGTGDTEEHHSPVRVQRFEGLSIRSLAAGFYHTIALVSRKHEETNTSLVVKNKIQDTKEENLMEKKTTCRPQDAARTILLDLERLALKYSECEEETICRWYPYCVEIRSETFEMLTKMIEHLCCREDYETTRAVFVLLQLNLKALRRERDNIKENMSLGVVCESLFRIFCRDKDDVDSRVR